MIEFRNLTKRFGPKIAVDNLALRLEAGEVFGFLGPNGAGKTTTIRLMAGLLRPTSGTVVYGDSGKTLDVQRDGRAVRSLLGYIPDSPFLYEKLTGREHLRFVGELYRVEPRVLDEEIDRYLALFDLSDRADRPIEGYSHGMRQKIVMSAALLHNPKVLVVDEPMVGLDPKSSRLVKNLFVTLAHERGVTVFLSTHSLDVAEEVCDRVGILGEGKLLALGSTKELAATNGKTPGRLEEVFLRITETDSAEVPG